MEYFARSPSIKVTQVQHDDSTSNLVHHAKACDGGMFALGSGPITAFAQGSTYTPHKFRMKLALWVARCHRPFAIVEDNELIDIFMDLNNKVEVPSCVTVICLRCLYGHKPTQTPQTTQSNSAKFW
jgi:hypothetical protein